MTNASEAILSNLSLDFSQNEFQPLAARMRPETLEQYIGQKHLLAEGKPLPRAINCLLYTSDAADECVNV